MYLKELHILNYKNIKDASLEFSPKINCLVGQNGMGKTNVLDCIYFLSFFNSAFTPIDSHTINHEADMAMIQGVYDGMAYLQSENDNNTQTITCGIRRGAKKQFRREKKDYKRLLDHIGLLPLVMLSPEDSELVADGSDCRRRFIDAAISQLNKQYLANLTAYNNLLKQRNTLLKQYADNNMPIEETLFEVIEQQMVQYAEYIFKQREEFVCDFIPIFNKIYNYISDNKESVSLVYRSQLHDRELSESFRQTRQRDLILGWTSQGTHKDDLDMMLGSHLLRQVGSQGQQKTYITALKLAQAEYMTHNKKPILLLDDIFDKLDSERVEKILQLVGSETFGQIFITDTDRQHISELLAFQHESRLFHVQNGNIQLI